MDKLKYIYANNNTSNQLIKVEELTGGNTTYGFKDVNNAIDYAYDANGNMVKDLNKGVGTSSVNGITYNHLNLPLEVKFNNSNTKKINYVYDASGVKLKKIVNNNGAITITEYAGNHIYENNTLQFFNHPEGYVKNDNGTFNYVYQYKDHLGNVRLSYTDNDGSGDINPATEIIEESNYYPFGLKHKGYNGNVSSLGNSTAQKYKYNGKELNEELGLNMYDYGARFYDPAVGRWFTPDALAEKYYNQSTYTYTLNNPIYYIDPDGNQVAMCCDALKGFITTMVDNAVGSNLRNTFDTGTASYGTGVQSGHAVSQIGGAALMISGAAGLAGSGALATTGVGAPVAGVTATGSAALVVKGAAELTLGASLLANGQNNMAADGGKFNRGSGGKRSKNRIPDKGEPNTVSTNKSNTTSKKYGSDGNVQKEFNKGHNKNAPKNEQSNHIHDYKPNPQNPTGRGTRQPGRPPKKGELIKDFGIKNNGNN